MKITVSGARGWIGSAVCGHAAQTGYKVDRIVRRAKNEGEFAWDFGIDSDLDPFARFLSGSDAVIHGAAWAHRPDEDAATRVLFQRVNVEGTRQVVQACQRAGVKRLVFVSTIALCRADGDFASTEDSATELRTGYAQSKREAERIVQESGLDWRIARLATVYGNGDRANFQRLALALKVRRFVVPGKGEARKSVLPIDRAAEMLVRLGLLKDPPYRLVNLASPLAPTLREICDGFSQVCGFPRAQSWSTGILRLGAWCGDALGWGWRGVPLNTAVLRKLTTSSVVDVHRQEEMFPDLKWLSFCDELKRFRDYYTGAHKY